MAYEPILTNRCLSDMKKYNISKDELLGAFHSNNLESTNIPGVTQGLLHIRDRVIGCGYKKNQRSQWLIIYCWSRQRY